MRLEVFDVEHGSCALLACDDNTHVLIDCGHNAKTYWRPGSHLRAAGIYQIEMLAITNYDEDHVSGIGNLFDNVRVMSLLRNTSVSSEVLRFLKSEDGMGAGINFLVDKIAHTFNGGAFDTTGIFRGLREWQIFYNKYPEFDDENNLSMVTYFDCHGVGVLFPGDIEAKGWRELMRQQRFLEVLRNTRILIAPHHGRESGCCEELRDYCNPYYVVISDKGYSHDTQETVPWYRSIARGGPFRSEPTRSVLTTRKDGAIRFALNENGWYAY